MVDIADITGPRVPPQKLSLSLSWEKTVSLLNLLNGINKYAQMTLMHVILVILKEKVSDAVFSIIIWKWSKENTTC